MKNYAIYSGKKIRMFIKTEDTSILEANLNEGEQYVETTVQGNPSLFMISTNEVVAIPPLPELGYKFNYDTLTWYNARTIEQQTAVVLARRNKALESSDWTDTNSAPSRLGTELYNQWQVYRQALRDITLQPDIYNISWPTPPQ